MMIRCCCAFFYQMLSFLKKNKSYIFKLFIFFGGLFALKGVSIILIPLYTSFFSTSEYGTIELANTIVSFLSIIIGFGLCQFLGIEYFHFSNERREVAILKNIKQYCLLSCPIAVLFIFAIFSNSVQINGFSPFLLFWIFLASFLTYFGNLCFMLCKNQQKTSLMSILQFLVGLTSLFINYFGICFWNWGINSIFISLTLSYFILLIFIPIVYKFNLNICSVQLSKNELVSVLRVSIPLALAGIISSMLALGDRWILNFYCSTSDIGIYALATRFSGIFELLVVNILTVFYSPIVYKSYQYVGIKEYERKNRRFFFRYFIFSLLFILFFQIVVKFLFPYFIDKKYNESLDYLLILLIGELFLGATYIRTYLLNYLKKSHYILLITLIATVFNILTNVFFIPVYKIYGAALTTAASQFLMFVAATIINRIEFKKL